MSQYSELKQALQPHLNWHGARLSFLTLFLLALVKVKTVNLSELALGFEGKAQAASKYKRLQRFFRGFEVDYSLIAKLVISWMEIPSIKIPVEQVRVGEEELIGDYALRWSIETLYGIFKTRGFCLESTHFTDPKRLRKLLALLTLALCWAIKTGLILHQIKPIVLKKHGRRAKSLFRLGFDHLRELVLNPSHYNESDFRQSLNFLSCT
ncbi:MAG: hypothetical protein AB4372_04120 [Xenococcus sp. (in: cyanobacteria)]